MSIVKRLTVEICINERPFKEGETLFSYAKRIMTEEGIEGDIIKGHVDLSVMQNERGWLMNPGYEYLHIDVFQESGR